jgi:quercetin dioxygenase-like cupin family protein
MIRPGDRIENPAMGAWMEFRDTAASTGGKVVRMEFSLAPGGEIAGEHMHPFQRERFEVLSGRMTGRVNGVDASVEAGGTSEMPPGVPHFWRNGGEEEARLILAFRPALRTEDFFDWAFALARRGKTDEHGIPRSYHKLTALVRFANEFMPVNAPGPVKWLFRARRRLSKQR